VDERLVRRVVGPDAPDLVAQPEREPGEDEQDATDEDHRHERADEHAEGTEDERAERPAVPVVVVAAAAGDGSGDVDGHGDGGGDADGHGDDEDARDARRTDAAPGGDGREDAAAENPIGEFQHRDPGEGQSHLVVLEAAVGEVLPAVDAPPNTGRGSPTTTPGTARRSSTSWSLAS